MDRNVKFLIREREREEGEIRRVCRTELLGLRVVYVIGNNMSFTFHLLSAIYTQDTLNTIPWSVKFYAVSLSIVGSRVERSGDRRARRCGNNRQTGNMSVGFRPGYESRRLVSQKQIRLGIGSNVYLLGHRQGPMGLSIPSRFRRAPCQPPSGLAFDDLFLLHFSLSLSLPSSSSFFSARQHHRDGNGRKKSHVRVVVLCKREKERGAKWKTRISMPA